MSKKNVLDSLLDALNIPNGSSNGISTANQPQKANNLSDKIPSAHSDLIITMILCHQNELFADNRKRKPIYNARRKAKWNELVENLNNDLNMEYSVERVKNNYHYRITSLKRNITKITSGLNDGEEIEDSAGFQSLSEIDKLLYEAVKSTCIEPNDTVPTKKKRGKVEKTTINDKINDNYSLPYSPALFSTDDQFQILDNQCSRTPNASKSEEPEDTINEYVDTDLNTSLVKMVRAQADTLDTMKQFMKDQMIHQAKILDLINSSTEVLRETASNLNRLTNPAPCPTCTDNFLETIIQACKTNTNTSNGSSNQKVSNLLSKKQNSR